MATTLETLNRMMEAKARRDVIRSAVLGELRSLAVPNEIAALLKADADATTELAHAIASHEAAVAAERLRPATSRVEARAA